jgi:hypothetical protein
MNQTFSHLFHEGMVIDVLDEYGELVAAQSSSGVLGAQGGTDASSHRAQQGIADRVAQRVVHRLEVIEIDEENGELMIVAAASLDSMPQSILQERTVGQAGQGIVEGLVLELSFKFVSARDVVARDGEPAPILFGDAAHRHLDIALAPVVSHEARFRAGIPPTGRRTDRGPCR